MSENKKTQSGLLIVLVFILAITGMLIISWRLSFLGATYTEKETRTYTYLNILSLERGQESSFDASGWFFLGFSASSTTNIVYYSYIEEEKWYTIQSFPLFLSVRKNGEDKSVRLYLIEDDSQKPKYKKGLTSCTLADGFITRFVKEDRYYCDVYRQLIVPKGTIHKEFRW